MFLVKAAYAQCPVCIVTVGGGMVLARTLKIDDFLVSLWISGLNTAISFWIAPKIKNKFFGSPLVFSLLILGFTLFYFNYTHQISSTGSQILGINKIVLGQIIGFLVWFLGIFIDRYSRVLNNHKILFPYQKVVFPFTTLLFFTILFKLIFKL
jgi:cell division protein FtsB